MRKRKDSAASAPFHADQKGKRKKKDSRSASRPTIKERAATSWEVAPECAKERKKHINAIALLVLRDHRKKTER